MAITFVQQNNANNLTSGSLGFTASNVSIGDLIIVEILDFQANVGTPTPATFTDTVNTGNYTNLFNVTVPPASNAAPQYWLSYKVCNAGGAKPTISTTSLGSASVSWKIIHYSGFLGTASYAGSGSSDWAVTDTFTSSTAVSGPSFNTSQNNELVVLTTGDMTGAPWTFSSGPSGWTSRNTNFPQLWDQSVTTAGTASQMTGTLSSAQNGFFVQAGFYDAVAATLSGYSSAAGLGPG
jgi:hypothetical protein